VRGPTVDVLSVGAGGGSIARIDEGGALRVGPESAGADPGPACYSRGTEPTVTDAHVVLGRIAPEQFLGGRMTIRPELSFEAMVRIAAPFGGDAHRAAAAVLRVANANMEGALRKVSVERGHDPRDFTLVAFGGAGPLHACDVAASLRIPRVLIPPHPGVLSALGMATAPIVKDLSAAVMLTIGADTNVGAPLRRLRDDLESRGRKELHHEGFSLEHLTVETLLEMRYGGQSYELSIPVQSLAPDDFLPRFHAAHHERYGHSDASRAVQVVTLRVKLVLPGVATGSTKGGTDKGKRKVTSAVSTNRDAWFNGMPARAAVYEREQFAPRDSFRGPALVVQMDSTTAVPPGWRAEMDRAGNLVLETA
jgi:N-methylhydantoinase A